MTTYINDTFTGANGAAWNSSYWVSAITTTGASATIQGNKGRLNTGTLTGGSGKEAMRYSVGAVTNTEITGTFTLVNSSTVDGSLQIICRANSALDWNNEYVLFILPSAGQAYVQKDVASVDTTLGTINQSFVQGTVYGFRFRIVGNSLKARIWTGAEPGTWGIDTTDSSFAGPGYFGLLAQNISTAGFIVDIGPITVTDGTAAFTGTTTTAAVTANRTATGTVTTGITTNISTTNPIGITDSVSVTVTRQVTVTDSIGVGDLLGPQTEIIGELITDQIGITDSTTAGESLTGTPTVVTAATSANGVLGFVGGTVAMVVTSSRSAIAGLGSGSSTPLAVTAGTVTVGAAGRASAGTTTAVIVARPAASTSGLAGLVTPTPATASCTATGLVNRIGGVSKTITATFTAQGGNVAKSSGAVLAVLAGRTVVGKSGYSGPNTGALAQITAARPASGVSQNLPTSLMADIWYASLPSVFREMDQATVVNGPRLLYRYMAATMSVLHDPEVIAERIYGGELTDPVTTDDAWIPWLAQVMGVQGVTVQEMRANILALSIAPSRGSAPYLIALIRPLLTGTQSITFFPQPPWTIVVRVLAGELGLVGGSTAGLRAAIYATGKVPTGFLLSVTTAGATWGEVDSVSAMWGDQSPAEPWSSVDSSGL